MQSELLAARERAAGLEAQVFAHTAAEYAGKGDTVLITEPLEGDGVRRLCDAVSGTCGGRCAVFAGTGGSYRWAVIHPGQDLRAFIRDMNQALHSRGGGRDGFAQGSAACTEEELRAYIATGEPMDKAGAYAIQGLAAMFVIGLDGDYYNVMGLPVCPLAMILRKFGVKLLGC